jgi:two-component system, cell cycle sensor histidine kinase and response regulator CckA
MTTAPSIDPRYTPPQIVSPRILIVEDERIVAGDIRSRLRRLGYSVVDMVSTGEDAILRAEALRPDLVLMDIRLEGAMDGIQAAEAIRSRFDIPVIYLSAFADKQTVERAKVTEPFGYLIKPFEDTELHSSIEVALYKRKTEAQRRALESQLLQAQKMESIGTLVVGLAHNLNNILAIILGYSSRLERTMDDPAKISQSVTAINQAVRRGASLIQQLIGVTTKANLQFASVDVNGLLQDLMRMVIEIFPRTITFHQQLDPVNPFVSADQNQLHQALLNILLNARDALPRGGTIMITTRMVNGVDLKARFPNPNESPYVCIEIRDNGEGMDPDTLRHAFEPFFTTRDRATSTGLGLSVVYGIVTSHKGFLDIQSTPSTGTTVTLAFPVEARAPSSLGMPSETLIAQLGGKETILIVEDEEMLRSLVREILVRAGYEVIEAVDGEEGVTVYREHHQRINLVLLDFGLPKMAGDEVFAELRRIRPDVRAIFSTGYVKKDKTDQLLALGAQGVVHKPFTVTEMLATIRRVLDEATA